MKIFSPDLVYKTINDIDLEKLKKLNIKGVILDIDNTLVPPHTPVADDNAKNFVLKLKDNGFKVCVVSNNIYERAEKFSNSLEVPFVCDGIKPSSKPFMLALEKLQIDAKNIAVVGDQVFTDVWGANRMKMISVLVEPVDKNENRFIKLKRIMEKVVVKRSKYYD